jgi:hypothetical protein
MKRKAFHIRKNQNTYELCSNNIITTILDFDLIHEFIYMPITHYNKFVINPKRIDIFIENEYKIIFDKYIKNASRGKE